MMMLLSWKVWYVNEIRWTVRNVAKASRFKYVRCAGRYVVSRYRGHSVIWSLKSKGQGVWLHSPLYSYDLASLQPEDPGVNFIFFQRTAFDPILLISRPFLLKEQYNVFLDVNNNEIWKC